MKNKEKKIKFRHRLEYAGVLLIAGFVRLLSDRLMYFIADRMADFAFSVVKMRRQVTLDNLHLAFPEKSEKELVDIAVRAYRGFARMIFDYSRLPLLNASTIDKYIETMDTKPIEEKMKQGKGVLMLSGHFGSWEICGSGLSIKGMPLSFLVGEQHNKLVDDEMNRLRMSAGVEIIQMGVALRGVIKVLRNCKCVAILVDQDAGMDGTFVNFFGKPASTPKGPAAFALKTKAAVFMMSCIKTESGRHKIVFEEIPVDSPDPDDPVKDITQRYTAVLEKHIRMHPDHYFWMHRRWKTRPEKD